MCLDDGGVFQLGRRARAPKPNPGWPVGHNDVSNPERISPSILSMGRSCVGHRVGVTDTRFHRGLMVSAESAQLERLLVLLAPGGRLAEFAPDGVIRAVLARCLRALWVSSGPSQIECG